MGFFDKIENDDDITKQNDYDGKSSKKKKNTSSSLGRQITSVESAKDELFKNHKRIDPISFIDQAVEENKTFYGQIHGGENDGEPFFLDDNDTTMELYVGSTGTGKGVYLGNKVLEAIRKGKGVIIIDPKKDAFLPQIIKEEMDRQSRPNDLQVVSWADNFGYTGINEFDTYKDVANKFIDALDLTPSDNQGVDYYRKNGRIMLNKVLKLFFDGTLGVIVKKDFSDILFHLQSLKEDLEKQVLLEREMGKMKPNTNLIEKYEIRYYELEKIEAVYWDTTAIETLDSLVKSVSEIADGANIYKKYDLSGALYEGKVLYMKVDMLDVASLKMIKLMTTDAIQQSRRKKANTIIIADELSFYVTKTIAGALATTRAMGLKWMLALQSLGQFGDDDLREAILDNCNVKMFYKISNKSTLEYVEAVGGKEAVTAYSMDAGTSGDIKISQQTEGVMNATRVRAMPRQGVGILIAEALPEIVIVRTNYIEVSQEFDWKIYETREENNTYFKNLEDNEQIISDEEKIKRFKVTMESSELLENSDIFGISYTSEKIEK